VIKHLGEQLKSRMSKGKGDGAKKTTVEQVEGNGCKRF